ncbi:MAG: FkbM family methyltransferase [Rhodospirillaceae bacterium]|nr:FkbM family methyltransferase [Rhodospirillaceae bacterium]
MFDPIEHLVATTFLQPGTVAIATGEKSDAWAAAATQLCSSAQVIVAADHQHGELGSICAARGLRHVRILRLTAQTALATLRGMERLLRYARVDVISCVDVRTREFIDEIRRLPALRDYHFYCIGAEGLIEMTPERGDLAPGAFFTVHQRLLPIFLKLPKTMLDVAALCARHGIALSGVIHIGAWEGREWQTYERMGADRVLFIEANPAVFERLSANLATVPQVILENCAIVDQPGPIALRVASSDQSSSVLPMRRHRDYYPSIVEEKTIEVPGKTLDGLLHERNLTAHSFNFLNIDIQGAELMALTGATETLRHIEAILVEVNFEELYEGNPQIEDIDDFLCGKGFTRMATTCPYHPSWGDAFYVRRNSRRP